MSYYSIISNNLFYIKEDAGLIKSFNDKLLLVCDYLYTNTNRQDISIFSLSDIVSTYNFKDNYRTNSQFKNIFIEMVNKKYITILSKDKDNKIIDVNNIKLNDIIRCKFNLLEKKDDKYIKFIQLFDIEKQKILNYKDADNKVDNVKLLVYYCYLKCRMYKRSNEDGDMIEFGGKTETCYPSFKRIANDINITENAIKKYNDILIKLDLIRVGNAGLYYFKSDSNKKLYESNNVYTLLIDNDEETAQNNLKESVKLYKLEHKEDRVFVNKKHYSINNRKINGYKGRIKYLIEQNKATDEQVEKYNEILKNEKNINIVNDDNEDVEFDDANVVKSLGIPKDEFFNPLNDWLEEMPEEEDDYYNNNNNQNDDIDDYDMF